MLGLLVSAEGCRTSREPLPVNYAALPGRTQPQSQQILSKPLTQVDDQRTEYSLISKPAAATDIGERLHRLVDLSWYPGMPFGEAVEVLKYSVEPPLKVVVLWRDLEENANVDRATPINMDPVSGIRLGTALKLLLRSVPTGRAKLGYIVRDGVVKIATTNALRQKPQTTVYDVSDLLSQPADYHVNR